MHHKPHEQKIDNLNSQGILSSCEKCTLPTDLEFHRGLKLNKILTEITNFVFLVQL